MITYTLAPGIVLTVRQNIETIDDPANPIRGSVLHGSVRQVRLNGAVICEQVIGRVLTAWLASKVEEPNLEPEKPRLLSRILADMSDAELNNLGVMRLPDAPAIVDHP